MNSLWLILSALAVFAVAYRYYSAFLATKVLVLDDARKTPAHRLRDGVDYHPTNKWVLFGHHFAAIAGPGPLVGPVLASQWGYLPSFLWIIIGACLAGAVHDFITLVASVRQDGLSIPKIATRNIGRLAGIATSITTLFITVCVLASVAMVVVHALSNSAWGMFTIIVTVPAALLTGLWMYKVRPGHIAEASAIGVTIVLLGVFLGKPVADSSAGSFLLFSETQLKVILPTYAFIASVLPVWVLMCPRDYLSSYMKIGVIVVLAVGIFAAHPTLKMPATTPFLSNGPIQSGAVWPFICIVVMCGAISGFHALVASGTTPKMVYRESETRPIGYGAMVLEGFVSMTALVAACALEPGDYFAINMPQKEVIQKAEYAELVQKAKDRHQWDLTPKELEALEKGTHETLAGRPGGAVTLAVGMAKVFSNFPGMQALMSYWYHFVIMFEALFILTLLETGTRVTRFIFQETLAQFTPRAEAAGRRKPNWTLNIVMSLVTCGAWGGLLWLGNIKTLWNVLGITNQLLASIALAVGTTYLLIHSPKRIYALCAGIPFAWVLLTTFTGGILSVQRWWGQIPNAPDSNEKILLILVVILAIIMLGMTVIISFETLRRWKAILSQPPAPPTSPAATTPAIMEGARPGH